MFIASYQRTMASAKKPRPKQDDGVRVVNLVELRKTGRLKRLSIDYEALMRSKAVADELVRRGRAAALKFRRERGEGYSPSFDVIEDRICRALKVTRREIRSARRNRNVVFARQAIMYWACRLTPMSTPEVGRALGGRDHTTVLHGRDSYVDKRADQGRRLRRVR